MAPSLLVRRFTARPSVMRHLTVLRTLRSVLTARSGSSQSRGPRGVDGGSECASSVQRDDGICCTDVWDASGWVHEAYVEASNTGAGDFFAAAGLSGATLVVGAPHELSTAVGVDGDVGDKSGGVALPVRPISSPARAATGSSTPMGG